MGGVRPCSLGSNAMRTTDLKFAPPTGDIAADCRHYRGDKPCAQNQLCRGCNHYQPYNHRVCIIKLGALGDVIRTLAILPTLHELYPNAQVTWVSKPNGVRMLTGHPLLDRVLPFDALTALQLQQERFDLAICLDKEPQPCALQMALTATRKLGMGLSPVGTPVPLNAEAHPYFHLGLSDELKFHHNRQTYPRLVHEALGWPYRQVPYTLPLDEQALARQQARLRAKGWQADLPTLGINVGAGKVFANKMWPAAKIVRLIAHLAVSQPRLQMVLLGGPEERPIVDEISAELSRLNLRTGIFDGGTEHDEPAFVALVECCDVLFSGDTMAMHVAIARGKQVVVFFGPTCAQEIDLYGRGEKLVASVACGPCYKRVCDQEDVCLNEVDVVTAASAIQQSFQRRDTGTRPLPVLTWKAAG